MDTNNVFQQQTFYSDQDIIDCCYKSDKSAPWRCVNSFSSTCDTVYVNNCANCHISNDISHFVAYKSYDDKTTDGCSTVGGGAKAAGEGTVHWSWQNDDGE